MMVIMQSGYHTLLSMSIFYTDPAPLGIDGFCEQQGDSMG
jgi:hypothetical protein